MKRQLLPSTGRVWLLVALLVLPGLALAQGTSGRLVGTVQDASGAVLPGATVTLSSAATGFQQVDVANAQGAFVFPSVPVGTYKLSVELEGFKTAVFDQVVINVGQEYSLTARLEIGSLAETVEVTAGVSLVTTTTPQVTNTVLQKQVLEIPLANRDITNLIKLQPGVQAMTNRANTVINGGRPTWTQVTLDGINIQDNFIRTNSLDFLPNRPTSDNVAEFTMTSSVQGADSAGGASSVRMVTPSGTNTFRGSVFEFNRDSALSANSFFNNRTGVKKPELSRHQFGGRLGGPVKRNKLFFFGYYEGWRQTTQTAQNLMVPANAGLLNGEFRYVGTDGVVRSVNVMQLSGLPIDPKLRTDFLSKIPGTANVNNYDIGNSRSDRILNTAGYRYNQTDLNNRDNYAFRLDYEMTANHRFEAVYSYFKETDDRTDLDAVTTDRPLVYTSSAPKRMSLAWRWLAGSRFQNEVRYGFNLAPVQFASDWDYASLGGVVYNAPLGLANPFGGYGTGGNTAAFQPQGRYTDTYQLNNNASMILGSHELQFGGSWQRNRVNPYNFVGIYPTVTFGFSSAAPAGVQLTTGMFPGGISAADLANANALTSFLGGIVTSTTRTFNVTDADSGYVPGVPADERYTLDNIALYLQDNWRWKPNFTIRAGIKWEYYSPLTEDNNLGFLPVTNGRPVDQFMLDPNTTLTFAEGDFWNKDLNNFGPTIGFAWDVTNDGKTAVRGGYSLTFVNEEAVTVGRSVGRSNTGLTNTPISSNQFTTVSAGVPQIPTPAFLSTRTLANQMATSATGILWGLDPNIQAPQVHQVSIGVQRELPWFMAIEARFVGSYGRDIWRGIDYNQVQINPAFLADFNRARTNGYAAQAAGLAYSPVYNPNVPGSQPLTVLPNFGLLTNATVVNNIQTNQVGALADFYIQSRVPGALSTFMQNPGIYSANAVLNGAFSDYNALQLDLRRQYRNGFFGAVNYTLSNTKTDSNGTGQNRFEAFMDNARPGLDTGRAVFHVTHVINANAIYELPFGQGRKWLNDSRLADIVFGGWQVSGIFAWQSGSPITVFSGRGTFNRAGRSGCAGTGCNTAFTTLSPDEVKKLFGWFEQNGNIYYIDPKVIDPATGRAVGADNLANAAGFAGQVFFNPGAGEVGNMELLSFDGPSQFRIDMALSKRIRLWDRYRLEFKGEAFNLTNTPSFFVGDQNINSTTFGRITSVNVGARVIQLSARFEF